MPGLKINANNTWHFKFGVTESFTTTTVSHEIPWTATLHTTNHAPPTRKVICLQIRRYHTP